jgi:hypothetical protein
MQVPEAEEVVSDEEREWRQRVVSLVISGSGSSDDLAPFFPCALPAGLPSRFASVSYRADYCVLSLHLETDAARRDLVRMREDLAVNGFTFPIDEPARVHAATSRPGITSSLELEALTGGLRVVWWLYDGRMSWLLDDQVCIERAQKSRRPGRQGL